MHWIDPTHLPETKGTVDRFLLNPHGDADGLLMTDGTEVHFPPHLSKQVVAAFKHGAEVKIRGVRPRGADMVAAVALETAGGTRIVDQGPPKKEGHDQKASGDHKAGPKPGADAPKPMDVEEVVRRVLHGPKGEARGALLEDGRILRIPPHAAASLPDLFTPGHKLAARGEGLTNVLGTVVAAREIGASLTTLRPVEPKKPDEHGEHKQSGEHAEHKPAKPGEPPKKHAPPM